MKPTTRHTPAEIAPDQTAWRTNHRNHRMDDWPPGAGAFLAALIGAVLTVAAIAWWLL